MWLDVAIHKPVSRRTGVTSKGKISLPELGHQKRGALNPPPLVSNGVLDRDLVEDGTVVQLDSDSVSDGPPLRVVVFSGEGVILDTSDLGTESVNSGISGSGVSAIQRLAISREGDGRSTYYD